jgi:O-antigen ligase
MAADSFVMPKETLGVLAALAAWTAIAVGLLNGSKLSLKLDPLNGIALLWLGWQWLAVLWAETSIPAIESALRSTVYLSLFMAVQIICGGYRQRVLILLLAVATSGTVLSGWVILRDFLAAFAPALLPVRSVLGDWRDALSQVGLGNTSHIADACVIGFLLWLHLLTTARHPIARLFCIVSLILHAAALVVCWSVHSNISLIVASAAYTWWQRALILPWIRRRSVAAFAPLLLGFVGVVAFYSLDHPLNPHGSAVWAQNADQRGGIFAQAFASDRWTSGLDTRLAIWLTTLEIIRQNPWLGTGPGTFTWVYPAIVSPIVEQSESLRIYSAKWTNAAHQEVLQTWAELGIIGLILLIALLGSSMLLSWRRLAQSPSPMSAGLLAICLAALVAIILQGQMNFPLRMPTATWHLYLLISMPLLLPRSVGEPWQLDVPVERPFGRLSIGILMRNMAYPTEISLRLGGLKAPARLLLATPILLIAALLLVPLTAPLRADLRYKEMRTQRHLGERGLPGANRAALAISSEVLATWPGHVDCRSARQQLLLELGEYEAVLTETPIVLQKLNAYEVYVRRAMALDALGRTEQADEDWLEVFRRSPDFGYIYREPYARVLPRLVAMGRIP